MLYTLLFLISLDFYLDQKEAEWGKNIGWADLTQQAKARTWDNGTKTLACVFTHVCSVLGVCWVQPSCLSAPSYVDPVKP